MEERVGAGQVGGGKDPGHSTSQTGARYIPISSLGHGVRVLGLLGIMLGMSCLENHLIVHNQG